MTIPNFIFFRRLSLTRAQTIGVRAVSSTQGRCTWAFLASLGVPGTCFWTSRQAPACFSSGARRNTSFPRASPAVALLSPKAIVPSAVEPSLNRRRPLSARAAETRGYRQKSVSVYPLFCQFTIDESSFQVATARLPYRRKSASDPGLTRLLRLAFSKKKSASGGGKRRRSGNAASAAHP